MNGKTTQQPMDATPLRRGARARRLASMAAALFLTFGTSVGLAGEASATATACAGFGCDDHNPNIQTWQSGPGSQFDIPHPFGGLSLRLGTTDGDRYAWARATYATGSGGGHVYVNRRNYGGGGFEGGLGPRELGQSDWTTSAGTNTIATWSGMYYDPSYKQVQACVYLNADGRSWCTQWFPF
ncbi:hypothetical protein [Streptomyces sp. NPDC046385]|uniref:hypothetical protein n=1 Tax=unclassified Streptomyces TaxID=2593676 RepID=UPI00340E65F1